MDAGTWAVGQRRLEVLGPLSRPDRRAATAVNAAARELGIERGHCYRLLRRLRAERTVTALLSRPGSHPVGRRLLSAEVESVVAAAFRKSYLDWRCPTVSDFVRDIERQCAAAGLKPRSRRAVALRFQSFDRREVLRRRKGARVA